MPEARVQLSIEVETEGAEQLTALRRELEQIGQVGTDAFARLDASLNSVLERLEQSRQLVAAATSNFLQSHRQLFTSLEPVFQGFFTRLLSGARNFRDALKRLLLDLLDFFLRTVARMVAGWLSGFRLMSALGGSALGGSGGAGGVFGLIAPLVSSGFGFQAGAGGTPPTFPTGGGGGLSATNIAILGKLGINLRGLGPIPGEVLAAGGLALGLGSIFAGYSRGSPLLGALGGAGGGALTGFAFGGPIGAAIGAIVGALGGLLGGIFGRGKLKRKATAVAVEGFAAMREIREQFKRFEVDFESALQGVDQVWQEMVARWNTMGKVGRRSISGQTQFYKIIRGQIVEIQKMREMRAALVGALPIPEFAQGGLVGQTFLSAIQTISSGQGKILAFLHQGEAVLNARAVARLGPQFIEQANRAPSFQQGGTVGHPAAAGLSGAQAGMPAPLSITINVHAAPGMDAEQLAHFTLRQLRRQLRDRGVRL